MRDEMIEVKEAVERLYEKYGEYTNFSYTCGTKSTKNNGFYERWNIYTPSISHNTFPTAGGLVEFINRLLKDNSLYRNAEMAKLKGRLLEDEKSYNETKDRIKLLRKEMEKKNEE